MLNRKDLINAILAVLIIVIISAIKLLVPVFGIQAPSLLYLFGVFVVANFWGRFAAVAALSASCVSLYVLFLSPGSALTWDIGNVGKTLVLFTEGSVVIWLVERNHRATRQLVEYKERLEEANNRITKLMDEVLDSEIKPASTGLQVGKRKKS